MEDVLTYAKLRTKGIITSNSNIINHYNFGKLINLRDLNYYLFGISELPVTTSMQILSNKKLLVDHDSKDKYLKLSKMKEYFESIGNLKNHIDSYIVINYYNIINEEFIGFNKYLNDWWINLKNKLKKEKNIYTKHILHLIGNENFKGILNFKCDTLNLTSLEFKIIEKKSISITFGFVDIDNKNHVNLSNPNNDSLIHFLIDYFVKINPDEFIISNISRVIGNDSLAKIIYTSHKEKDKCNIPNDQLDFIINFKSIEMKDEYLKYFKEKYKHKQIYKKEEGMIFLNFEGLNKYILNIEEKYLFSFEIKEMINDMYFQITNELIENYKYLFNTTI